MSSRELGLIRLLDLRSREQKYIPRMRWLMKKVIVKARILPRSGSRAATIAARSAWQMNEGQQQRKVLHGFQPPCWQKSLTRFEVHALHVPAISRSRQTGFPLLFIVVYELLGHAIFDPLSYTTNPVPGLLSKLGVSPRDTQTFDCVLCVAPQII